MPKPPRDINNNRNPEDPVPGECELNWVVRRNVDGRYRAIGLTQTQLADAMKIALPSMNFLLKGRSRSTDTSAKTAAGRQIKGKIIEFNVRKIERAAKVLGCSAVDLVTPYRFFPPKSV